MALGNTMKIGQQPDFHPTCPQVPGSAAVKPGENQTAVARGERKAPGVDLTVSDRARVLGQARLADSADIDMEKVNAVRQAIEQKTYQVNPEAIADKLLANAQELLNRTLS